MSRIWCVDGWCVGGACGGGGREWILLSAEVDAPWRVPRCAARNCGLHAAVGCGGPGPCPCLCPTLAQRCGLGEFRCSLQPTSIERNCGCWMLDAASSKCMHLPRPKTTNKSSSPPGRLASHGQPCAIDLGLSGVSGLLSDSSSRLASISIISVDGFFVDGISHLFFCLCPVLPSLPPTVLPSFNPSYCPPAIIFPPLSDSGQKPFVIHCP